MTGLIKGRSALVTGGGQGVGQGIARALAAEGADVMIAQRNLDAAEAEAAHLRETSGVNALARQVDVTTRGEVDAMVEACAAAFGRLDILVNNAGASFPKRFENHTDEDMEGAFLLNYWSAF